MYQSTFARTNRLFPLAPLGENYLYNLSDDLDLIALRWRLFIVLVFFCLGSDKRLSRRALNWSAIRP
jgi:hypothetical protein